MKQVPIETPRTGSPLRSILAAVFGGAVLGLVVLALATRLGSAIGG